MTHLTIGGDTIEVLVEGDATRPALMLSNALGTDLTMWDGQMPLLIKHFRVIRYDTRGHGGSAGSDGPISIGQLGRDVIAILDALEIEKVHWIGLSMGGAIGMWLLANAPGRIGRAVLANTAPRFGTPETWNARIAAVLSDGMTDTASATLKRWFSPSFAAHAPDKVDAIRDLLLKTSPNSYAACCAALRDLDLRDSLRMIRHDVLVVTGRDDPVVPAADSAALIAALSARHVVLEARHLSNVETEADFNTAVVSFLTAKLRAKPVPIRAMPRKARKAAPTKAASAKRGSATGRSNAARNPLKKPAAKRKPAKAARVQTTRKKPATARRGPVAKAATPRATAPKAVKRTAAKAKRKAVTSRRPTPATARAPIAVKKAKTTKTKAATKRPVIKKSVAKKTPITRRKSATKPRRPTGRRKP